MNNWNNTSPDIWLTEQLFNRIEEENNWYSKKSNQEKEQYWMGVMTKAFHTLNEWEKIDIAEYRETEPNIDTYLSAIINNIESYHWEDRVAIVNNYFLLDEQAKTALKIQSNVNNNLWQVNDVLKLQKTEQVEWVKISNEELADRIWDLYYDALAVFLSSLWGNVDNQEVSALIDQSSMNISEAWELCKEPTIKFLAEIKESWEKFDFKHTWEVKWLDINRKELAKRVWNLVDTQLKDFLEKLSLKMQKDWDADYYREPKPRPKLWTELYACSNRLKDASEKL